MLITMKKYLLFAFAAFTVLTLALSCRKSKDYACECTYVSETQVDSNGNPVQKVEATTTSGTNKDRAAMNCRELESKYWPNDYRGTCILKD